MYDNTGGIDHPLEIEGLQLSGILGNAYHNFIIGEGFGSMQCRVINNFGAQFIQGFANSPQQH